MITRYCFLIIAFILFDLNLSVHAATDQTGSIAEQFAALSSLPEDDKNAVATTYRPTGKPAPPIPIEAMSLARADLAQKLLDLLHRKTKQDIGLT
jgi:hypothetical protein